MNTNYITVKSEAEQNGLIAIEKNVFIDLVKKTLIDHKYTNLATYLPYKTIEILADENNKLTINVVINVKYGNNVMRVIEDIQKKIHNTIINSTNIEDIVVNVGVVGFVF